jgi:hypothetical protein
MNYAPRIAVVLLMSMLPALTMAANDLSAFVGRWQLNPGLTKMGRMGPTGQNIVRSPTFSWVFTPEGQGLRMDVYSSYPQPVPTRSMTVIADQQQRPCLGDAPCLTSGGNPREQTYAYYYLDARMLARLFYIKGQMYEYSSYAVSTDGKRFTVISWSPETPEYQNIQVFDKQP